MNAKETRTGASFSFLRFFCRRGYDETMNRILRRSLLMILAALLPFFMRQNPLNEEEGRPTACSFEALSEGTVLPYGLHTGAKDNESYEPYSSGVSLRRWKKTDSASVFLKEVFPAVFVFFSVCQQDHSEDSSSTFSALFLSGGTYNRKLVPRSIPLS